MWYRLLVAALVGVAFVVSACDDPAPTEPSQDKTSSLSAAPKKAIPFTAVWDLTGPVNGANIINPECIYFDAKQMHYDKCILISSLTGDLDGGGTSLHKGHIVLATGAGKGHGHYTMNVCHADFGCGTFKGRYHTESQLPQMIVTEAPGHGSGDFHTLQIRWTGAKRPDAFIFDIEGIIF